MNPSQLIADLGKRGTWQECENRLIDLMTTGHDVLDFQRTDTGFDVTLNGITTPIKVPYRPGGQPKQAEPQSNDLDGFEESKPMSPPTPPTPPKRRAITVPPPVRTPAGKKKTDELMVSVGGLMVKYEKHAREVIRFALSHAGMQDSDIDQAVDDITPRWVSHLKEKLPS